MSLKGQLISLECGTLGVLERCFLRIERAVGIAEMMVVLWEVS